MGCGVRGLISRQCNTTGHGGVSQVLPSPDRGASLQTHLSVQEIRWHGGFPQNMAFTLLKTAKFT